MNDLICYCFLLCFWYGVSSLPCQGILSHSGNSLSWCPLLGFHPTVAKLWFSNFRISFLPSLEITCTVMSTYFALAHIDKLCSASQPFPHHSTHRENDNLCRQTGVTDKDAFGWSLVQLPWEANIVQGTFLMLAGKLCVVEHEFLHSVDFYSSYTGTSNTVMDRTHSLPLRSYITLAYVWI